MPEARRPVHTPESLVARLRELAAATGRDDISKTEFLKATGISRHHITRAFGGYAALREAAGMRAPFNTRLDNDTMLRLLRDACVAAGGVPSFGQIERFGAPSKSTYCKRWRNWRGVQQALREWLTVHDPGSPYLTSLQDKPSRTRRRAQMPAANFGAPLHSGPLLHEPTNEMGVVALFGGLATALGFSIERVGIGFPDCEAKQRVTGGWRRVRIEFEYQSRNFERHGHDPEGCDLIVCWEHNWEACPLDVLELKEYAARGGPSLKAPNSRPQAYPVPAA